MSFMITAVMDIVGKMAFSFLSPQAVRERARPARAALIVSNGLVAFMRYNG